jgi:hypothetical protein
MKNDFEMIGNLDLSEIRLEQLRDFAAGKPETEWVDMEDGFR